MNYTSYREDPNEIPLENHKDVLQLILFDYDKCIKIPETLINLECLICENVKSIEIPKTLFKLRIIYCKNVQIDNIPDTLIYLAELTIFNDNNLIIKLPKTLIRLEYLWSNVIKTIPDTLTELNHIRINDGRCYKVNVLKNLKKYLYEKININILRNY